MPSPFDGGYPLIDGTGKSTYHAFEVPPLGANPVTGIGRMTSNILGTTSYLYISSNVECYVRAYTPNDSSHALFVFASLNSIQVMMVHPDEPLWLQVKGLQNTSINDDGTKNSQLYAMATQNNSIGGYCTVLEMPELF